jgi:hypothetical protein
MDLKLVLERLAFTIEKAKELKPEQFNYSCYVRYFDHDNNCGTVCCILGHYPNWGIIGFRYEKSVEEPPMMIVEYGDFWDVSAGLIFYHGLSEDIIDFLFYGYNIEHSLFQTINDQFEDQNVCLELNQVIQRFEYVYELLKTERITPDFTA